jgi:lipoyl(octanoyl) transferase
VNHPRTRRPIEVRVVGTGPDAVDYLAAWDLQRQIHADVLAGTAPGTLLLLEHPSVYTAGRRTEPHERPDDGTPVVEVDRGGKITWHGPGQIVGYPIVKLPDPRHARDHVSALEEAIIEVCGRLGLTTGTVPGRTGVWVDENRKIAAIGVRISRGVSMHGFALNCDPDLTAFSHIVPCGLDDADVTSLSAELARHVTVDEVLPLIADAVPRALDAAHERARNARHAHHAAAQPRGTEVA